MNLKVLHLNIEKNKHLDTVLQLLSEQRPDIACFAEAMQGDMKKLSKKLEYELVFAPLVNIKNKNGQDQEGSAILSRVPIQKKEIHRYDGNSTTEIPTYTEGQFILRDGKRENERWLYHNSLLTASILIDNTLVTIATTHFPVTDHSLPKLSSHNFSDLAGIDDIEHARVYFDRLIQIIRVLPSPIIFTSDLNNTRGEYVYNTLAHELVDIVPQSVISSIDPVLHRRPNLQLMVDTIMTSSNISVGEFKVIEGVSDHKAFIASLTITK